MTPTKEQVYEIIKKMPSEYSEFYFWGMSDEITEFIITEWEKIKNTKRLRLEVGKTYLTETGRECKIVYKSPIRGTGYLGILATNFETHSDDAVWYNPDGTHNEKCNGINLVKEKL